MNLSLRLLATISLLTLAAAAAEPTIPPPPVSVPSAPGPLAPLPKKQEKSQWVFSLLPKSLQQNPSVDLTVITEMTELGKKQPPATPEHPVYYISQSAGFSQRGDAPGNEHTLKPEDVERLLTRALRANGFLPAEPPAHPATLVVFYTWGSHNALVEPDPDNPSLSADAVARNLLDRAALVGGEKFAAQMLKLFQQADDQATLNQTSSAASAAGIPPVMGDAQMQFTNPVNLFKQASAKNEFLVDQMANDVYFVVASAYDYVGVATKSKRLYWRTRMTVASAGVSQEQTLPTLIASAAPYFGREMDETDIITKKVTPEGKVDVGVPYVVGNDSPPAAPAPKPKKP